MKLLSVFVQSLTLYASLHATGSVDGKRLNFDFAKSDHGFIPGFADYPADHDPDIYNMTSDWLARPDNLGGEPALFISGMNRSDDLWMYWKKRISGLSPNTDYVLTVEVEFASKYPTGSVGIGGSPADSVFFKTGASRIEPIEGPDNEGWMRLNLDKGNQSAGGSDVLLRGTIAKPEDGNADYVLLTKSHHGDPQTAASADDGTLWLLFGTDSGYEGETSLYYTRLTVWINRLDKPYLWLEPGSEPGIYRLIWNNAGTLRSNTDLGSVWPEVPVTKRPHLHHALTEPRRFWRLTLP